MSSVKLILFVVMACLSSVARAGNESGGGGDEIRANFLSLGSEIILFLATDRTGIALTEFHQLDVSILEATLSIDRISVTDQAIVDRTGSIVDAVISENKLLLNQQRWLEIFASSRDVRYLVFHEMLRLSGINDDNYLISKGLREALVRRESLPESTERVSIVCTDVSQLNTLRFLKRRDQTARLIIETHSGSGSRRREARSLVRISQALLRAQLGPAEALNVQFNQVQSSATIRLNTASATELSCVAESGSASNSHLRIGLSLALDYVTEGINQ